MRHTESLLLVLCIFCTYVLADLNATAILIAHNNARAQILNPPQNTPLNVMTYDSASAAMALSWAQICPTTCIGHNPNNGGRGENIYWRTGAPSGVENLAVNSWMSESVNYNFNANSCSGVCGHYTQVVWNATTLVGCASYLCNNDHTCANFFANYATFTVVVCNYYSPGNYNNQKPYTAAPITTPSITTSPLPSPSSAASATSSATVTPTISITRSLTPAPSVSPTISITSTTTPAVAASQTPTISVSISITTTSSISITRTITPTATPTVSPPPSTCNPACSQYANCSNNQCTCLSGYTGNGITCTPISSSQSSFLNDFSIIRGNPQGVTFPGDTMLLSSVTNVDWAKWLRADAVISGSTTFYLSANLNPVGSSGDIGIAFRLGQGNSREKDAMLWHGTYSGNTIDWRFCFIFYNPGETYDCSGSSFVYGSRTFNPSVYNSISVKVWTDSTTIYTYPMINGASAINYAYLYTSLTNYPQAGGFAVTSSVQSQVNNLFVFTQNTVTMSLVSCQSQSSLINLVASALGISASNIQAASVPGQTCSTKRSLEEVAATGFTVTLSSTPEMVSSAMATKLSVLSSQGALPGVSSVQPATPIFAVDPASAIAVAPATTGGVGTGGVAVVNAGGAAGGGLSAGAIVGIVLGSVGGAVLLLLVATLVVAAIIAAAVYAKRRGNGDDNDDIRAPGANRASSREISLETIEAAANNEDPEGPSVRKTIFNLFRSAPKGGVNVLDPQKSHTSITARSPPMQVK